MLGRVQYRREDRTTTVLRNLMACSDTLGCFPDIRTLELIPILFFCVSTV
jgi:hypothetical protein